jgi:hypothetical protein
MGESRQLSRQPNARAVTVHLQKGQLVQGSITAVTWGTLESAVTVEHPHWPCGCGAVIDTETAPTDLIDETVTGGFRIRCQCCGRWYMVACDSGRCVYVSEWKLPTDSSGED